MNNYVFEALSEISNIHDGIFLEFLLFIDDINIYIVRETSIFFIKSQISEDISKSKMNVPFHANNI